MRFALVLIMLGGCGDSPSGMNTTTPDAEPDAEPDAKLPPGFPARLDLGASMATIALPFDVSIAGSAAAPLGNVSIAGDTGTYALGTETGAAFVYDAVPFGNFTLYQGFAITPSRWDVFWLYCQGTGLAYIYDEGVHGPPLFYRAASGTCQDGNTSIGAAIKLPAFSVSVPAPTPGFAVTGNAIRVDHDGTGTVTFGGQTFPLVVFGDVDCSTACGSPGWYELHSIVWDDARHAATFVIIYLNLGTPASVELAYARTLPDLGDPIGDLILPATWSVSARETDTRPRLALPPPSVRLLRAD